MDRFKSRRPAFVRGLSFQLGAALACLLAGSGHADERLAPVTVYGARNVNSLDDASASVGVVNQADIENRQLRNFRDAFRTVANVMDGDWPDAGFVIRGVNSEGLTPGGDPLASLYIDGSRQTVDGARRGARGLWDVEQVEVYRGPQSTLSERASLAGAIYVKTRDPSYDWDARVRVDAGTRNARQFAFAGGGPLVPGELAFPLAAESHKSENDINYPNYAGFVRYREFIEDEYRQLRGKLLREPSALPGTRILFAYSDARDSPHLDDIAGPALGFDYSERRGDFNAPVFAESRTTRTRNASLEITHAVNDALLFTALTGWSDSAMNRPSVNQGTPGETQVADGVHDQRIVSQEARFNYSDPSNPGQPVARAAARALAAVFCGTALHAGPALAETAAARNETVLPVVEVLSQGDTAQQDRLLTQKRPARIGKSSVSIQDTPFSMSVIDVEQIRDAGAKNVQDALLYSAGVYAGRYGFDTRGDWSAIRGLSPAAYIDGLRYLYGFYNNVRPEIYTLDSVEVLKGPASALYGQGDLGGIVNVTTKRPQAKAAKEIEVQFGSHNRKQLAADLTGPLNADGTLLYRLVALTRDSDTQVDFVHDDARVFLPALTWRPNRDTEVTLFYVHQKNETRVSAQFLPSKGTLDPAPLWRIPSSRFVGEPGWDRYDMEKDDLSLVWNQTLVPDWKLSAIARKTRSSSVTREHWTTVGAIPDDAGNMTRSIHTADRKTDVTSFDARAEGRLALGPTRHTVTLGLDYQDAFWEEYNYTSLATGGGTINVYNPVYGFVNFTALTFSDRPDNAIEQTGVYLSDHAEWGPWVLSGAVRRDSARDKVIPVSGPASVVKNTETSGRVGLMYRFANGLSPYVSWSTAFQPNLGTDGTPGGGFLKPTTGEQKELGAKYLSAGGDTSVAFAAFEIEQQNRIVDGATPGGVEQVGAKIDGWEIELRQRFDALELTGNFTRLEAVNPTSNTRIPSIPEVMVSAWGQYHFDSGWRVGLGGRHTGSVTGAGGRPVLPSVSLYDAMVGYTTGAWDVRLTLQNLADKEYVSWCRGLNLDCGYGERRNVLLTARYRF